MARPPRRKSGPPAPGPRPPSTRKAPPAVETVVERLDDDGIAVARHEGRELLVAGALPGERIRAVIEHRGQRRSVGRLDRVLAPHPQRVEPPCPCAGDCLGCPLIGLDYGAQLAFKEQRVTDALAAHPTLENTAVEPILGAERPLGYRTTAKLALAKERGRVKVGLYRRGSHEVVDSGDCPLHHPLINRIVAVVREEIRRQGVWIYDARRDSGLLRYLLVRVSPDSGKAMVTFVTARREMRQVVHLAKWLQRKIPEVVSVQQNINPGSGNVILGRETLRMVGAPDLFDQVGAVRLRIAPTAFFQVNHEQAARIYALVRRWASLSREETAVDLYCGIGGIALHLALDAGRVVGIEAVPEAVRNARENARLNGQGNCTFRTGAAEEMAEELAREVPAGSVAVVNPPRSGCERPVLEALAGLRPRLLVYVSCNPETLARDLASLAGLGYRTEQVQPVDMFPQTAHVESVARLVPDSRGKKRRKPGQGRKEH